MPKTVKTALLFIILFYQGILEYTVSAQSKISQLAHEFTLDNGMKFVFIKREGLSSAALGWVAKTGSASERPGITGMTHFFEHMLFKGTSRIGVVNPALDFQIREQLDILHRQILQEESELNQPEGHQILALEKQGKEKKPLFVLDLRKQFKNLLEQQRKNLRKEEFHQIYRANGAKRLNAFTTQDMTAFFLQLPSNRIELWFWMESDRLRDPVFREFFTEKEKVFEERRLRIEETPTGIFDETFNSLFWRTHPYSWPVSGWPQDVAMITRGQAKQYFSEHYAPNNIVAFIIADAEKKDIEALATKYFGNIPERTTKPSNNIASPQPFNGRVKFEANIKTQNRVELRFITAPIHSKYAPALQVLSSILSGKSGRLHKKLVEQYQLANALKVSSSNLKYAGSFSMHATYQRGNKSERIHQMMMNEIESIRINGVSEVELEEVKNNYYAQQFRQMRSPFQLMMNMLYFEGISDWRFIDYHPDRIMAVTNEMIKEAIALFLNEQQVAVKYYYKQKADLAIDENMPNLPKSQVETVRKMFKNLRSFPKNKLPQQVEQLESQFQRATPKRKAMYRYVLSKLRLYLQEGQ